MSDALAEIDSLDLKPLGADGKPPRPSRLSSASSLRSLYTTLVYEDQISSLTRLRIQAMKDGEPPYNQAALNAAGQGSRANANFLMGQDLITKANNGYLDIFTSPKCLVTLDVEGGEPNMRISLASVIASELTRTMRKWQGFKPNCLRLVDLFDTHGVGVTYFSDTKDFRSEVVGLAEFLIPRQTKACEENVLYAIARRDMTVSELFQPIEDEDKATKLGWNVNAVKAAIGRAVKASSQGEIGEWEKFQQQIKNNDLFCSRQFEHVPILYGWVREFDGTISFFMAEKNAPDGEFLFQEMSRYQSAEEAFIFFCYGIGNGTYHSIRGLGHMIFALVQLHNRMMCQKADGSMLEDAIIVQATSANALQNASMNTIGPMALLSPDFEVIDRKMPGGSERTMPFLREVKSLMGNVSSRFMTPATDGSKGGVYQNELSSEFDIESVASGDSGAIDLFYGSLDRWFRQMCIRIIEGPKTDKLVAEFHRRCAKYGVTEEILKSVDFDSICAYRTLGAGSPAARSISFKKLMQILPQLDEIGRKNLIYDFVEDAVGYQNASRYASASAEPRLGSEAGMAELENMLLIQGNEITVFPEQLHATHVQIHIPKILEVLDAVERGEIDPMQNLAGLQASLNHIAAHGGALAIDPTQAAIYGQVKEAVNNLQQVVTNMERKIKAAERKAAESGAVEGTPEAENATQQKMEEIKLATAEFQFNLTRAIGEFKLADMQSKSAQALALNDLKAAQQAQLAMRFPGTKPHERR